MTQGISYPWACLKTGFTPKYTHKSFVWKINAFLGSYQGFLIVEVLTSKESLLKDPSTSISEFLKILKDFWRVLRIFEECWGFVKSLEDFLKSLEYSIPQKSFKIEEGPRKIHKNSSMLIKFLKSSSNCWRFFLRPSHRYTWIELGSTSKF